MIELYHTYAVYQLLVHGRWFSPGTPASSTTTTGRHDIAEILLKVALNTKNKSNHVKENDMCTYCDTPVPLKGGRDRMIVGFATTCAISAYHH